MGKPTQPETERNKELYTDFKCGMSYIDLVAKYRISSQRVWQIVKREEKMEAQGLTINPAGKLSVGKIWSELDGKKIE